MYIRVYYREYGRKKLLKKHYNVANKTEMFSAFWAEAHPSTVVDCVTRWEGSQAINDSNLRTELNNACNPE